MPLLVNEVTRVSVAFGLQPEANLQFEQIAAAQQQVTALTSRAKFQAADYVPNVPTRQVRSPFQQPA